MRQAAESVVEGLHDCLGAKGVVGRLRTMHEAPVVGLAKDLVAGPVNRARCNRSASG